MGFLHLFLLSVVQGITEFLPISSSAHLVLFPKAFGAADQGLVIDLAVHVGSLLAVLLVFRRDIGHVAGTALFYKKAKKNDKTLLWNIGIAALPVLIVGWAMHHHFPDGVRDVTVLSVASIVFGLFLFFADRFGKTDKTAEAMTGKDALMIGLAHICALVPGASRSGVTMTMARACGLSRVEAARFSLLIGVPVIAGAGFLGLLDVIRQGNAALGFDALLAVLLSFAASWLSIVLMMRWLKKSTFLPFVIYRLCFGVAALIFFAY
jgi:undecaprenyl-diphosphatase